MKVTKLFLAIILLILIIPVVSAEIKLDSFTNTVYNLGDKVLMSGSVTYGSDVRGSLELKLSCNGVNNQIGAVLLNLKTNQQMPFSNFVTLPMNLVGKCKIITNLVDNQNKLFETKEFSAFDLSNELKGNFEINKKDFQLGEQISILGSITKQNGEPVDGVFVISFKKVDSTLFMDTVRVSNGIIDYKKTLTKVPPATYLIDVSVRDNLGNSKSFPGLFNLVINGNLEVSTNLDKTSYSPGDNLVLGGQVNSGTKVLNGVTVEFNFENQVQNKKLASSNDVFSVTYTIPAKIKSGNHNISIIASDEEGNYGVKDLEFNVVAVPTILSLGLNESAFDPEQNVGFTITLLDQAGDSILDNVNVGLINNKGNVVSSKIVKAGSSDSITLPKQATPGNWKLKVEGFGLKGEYGFIVREAKKLDASINGTKLTVENVGNVEYKGLFDIFGNELNKSEKLDLDVGEKEDIDLGDLFPEGIYKINLPSIGKYFDNVILPKKESIFDGLSKITGNVTKNTSGTGRRVLLFVALIIVSCSLIYVFFVNRKKKERVQFNTDEGYLSGKKKLEELRSKGIRKDRPIEYGKATQADVEDWKKRVQQSIKEQEQKEAKNEFVGRSQKSVSNDRPGMFNMFG